jgi:hypothetical protein
VCYTTAAALVNELVEAADDRALTRAVARYGRLELLCLDELGYLHLDPRGAELLFQVLTEREERASVAVASNAPFSEWGPHVHRPPPGRRRRRPAHLQRPHPRNRNQLLPTAVHPNQQRHRHDPITTHTDQDRRPDQEGRTHPHQHHPPLTHRDGGAQRSRPGWGQIKLARWGQMELTFSHRRS